MAECEEFRRLGKLMTQRVYDLRQSRHRVKGKVRCAACHGWLLLSDFDRLLRDQRRRRKKCRRCVEVEKSYLRRNRVNKKKYDKRRRVVETEVQRSVRNRRRRVRYATDRGHRRRYENMRRRHRDRSIETEQRRARLMDAAGSFSKAEWSILKRQYGFRCAYCCKRKKLTMDHVVPLIRGGRHDKTNIVPACVNCNAQKHTADWSDKLRRVS